MPFEFMPPKRLIYFTSQRVAAYLWKKGELREESFFAHDQAGVAAFSKFVSGATGSLFYLLVDVVEEDFFQESIPYVRGTDRRGLLARKLAQRYRDTTLAMPLSLGSDTRSGRREERILYASFTNTQQFQPWLAAFRASEARLAGVFSVALVSAVLGRRIGVKLPRYLMVSLQQAGLRQSYIENGRIRFSRLSRVDFADPQAAARDCAAESARIQHYLANTRVLPREAAPLDVVVLAPTEHKALYDAACTETPRLRFRVRDLDGLGRRIGLRSAPAETLAEGLFLYVLGAAPVGQQFADNALRRFYDLWRARVGLVGAGAAVLGLCVLFAAMNLLEIYQMDREESRDRLQEARALQEYARVRTTFPKTPIPSDSLKSIVRSYRALLRQSASPGEMFVAISRAVTAFPQVDLERLDWQIGSPRKSSGSGEAQRTAAPGPGMSATESQLQTAELSCRLSVPQASDYRAITDLIDRFTDALRRQSGLDVVGARLPFDITAEKSISGEIGAQRSVDVPRFSVTVRERRGA